MYNIITEVIKSKNYELTDMLRKIDTIWLQGNLSDEQKTELVELARANADMTKTMDIYATLENLESRVRALEENKSPAPSPDYPDYVVGKVYHHGDKATFGGKHYECICPSYTTCVWSPANYPDYWKEVA